MAPCGCIRRQRGGKNLCYATLGCTDGVKMLRKVEKGGRFSCFVARVFHFVHIDLVASRQRGAEGCPSSGGFCCKPGRLPVLTAGRRHVLFKRSDRQRL